MMALTQENVHCTLNSGPGVMNKLNRVHARIQEFLSGGGGGGLWIRTWGRLMPLFAYRIMVYQNLNKTKKYHQTTTKRKNLSPADRDSKCGSIGGSGGPDPPGKSQVIWPLGFYRV